MYMPSKKTSSWARCVGSSLIAVMAERAREMVGDGGSWVEREPGLDRGTRLVHAAKLRTIGYENATNERGEKLIWLDRAVVDRLRSPRGRGESWSEVILRIAGAEA